jgi:hypothetical protein
MGLDPGGLVADQEILKEADFEYSLSGVIVQLGIVVSILIVLELWADSWLFMAEALPVDLGKPELFY